MELRTSVVIAMAHRLHEFDGPCSNLHGHNWEIVAICGIDPEEVNNRDGFVIEFGKLRKLIKDSLTPFDHSTVLHEDDDLVPDLRRVMSSYHILNVPPTTEHLASLFYGVIDATLQANYGHEIILSYIELHETPNNCVVATAHSTGVKLV
jgi:6-pyruvoyltetrahydropterin/6-carboxytetrahydropterin synthase